MVLVDEPVVNSQDQTRIAPANKLNHGLTALAIVSGILKVGLVNLRNDYTHCLVIYVGE